MEHNIDTYSLKIFREVATCKNISKASENLYISQPAVSKIISKLEREYNTNLFIRQSKGVLLTKTGEILFNGIDEILLSCDSINARINKQNSLKGGIFAVGSGANISKWVLNQTLINISHDNSDVKFVIKENPTDELINQLSKNLVDCILIPHRDSYDVNFDYITIAKSKYVFIAGSLYKDICEKDLTILDLVQYPFILQSENSSTGRYFNNYCKKNNKTINARFVVDRFNLITELVVNNLGIGFVPEYVANEVKKKYELYILPVKEHFNEVEYDLVYLKNNNEDIILKKLLVELKTSKKKNRD